MPGITIVLGAGPATEPSQREPKEEAPAAEMAEESKEYGFGEKDKLPFAALTPKERIRREFGEGMALSDAQTKMLECFEALPSTTQNMLLRKSSEAGQQFVGGTDLLQAKEMIEGDSEKRESEFDSLESGEELDDTTESEFD